MCIIIYRPAENNLSAEMLHACFTRNSDGWGIMMPSDTGIVSYKGMLFPEFAEVYDKLPKNVVMAIHFRIKTHGLINLQNCHPFKVLDKATDGEDLFMMHNGTINTVKCHDKTMSDTWHWSEILVRPIVKKAPHIIYDEAFQWHLANSIGYSRVLFLTNEGEFIFLKEDDWKVNKEERDGCRYSCEPPLLKKPEPVANRGGNYGAYNWNKNNGGTNTGAASYTDHRQPGIGYGGSRGSQFHTVHEYDEEGVLVKTTTTEGGGTSNGSNRFQGENVISLGDQSKPGTDVSNKDTTANNPGTIIGLRGSTTPDTVASVQDATATEEGPDGTLAGLINADQLDLLANQTATAEGMPEGGETAEAGLLRFPGDFVEKPPLTKEQWGQILAGVQLDESEDEEDELDDAVHPTEAELEAAHREDMYSYGIIPNTNMPLGLEFDNQRTHMLTTEKGSEDELPTLDPEDFEGASFVDILSFVTFYPEEAALFLYRNVGG